jgi:hypothetical protein
MNQAPPQPIQNNGYGRSAACAGGMHAHCNSQCSCSCHR